MLRYQKNEHNKRYDEKICQGKMRHERYSEAYCDWFWGRIEYRYDEVYGV